jgi:hypothetical protein
MLETLVLTPSINKIEITISKPSLLNINPKLAIVTQPMSIINQIPIIKSEKLPNPLIFNRNQNNFCPFITKFCLKLSINHN